MNMASSATWMLKKALTSILQMSCDDLECLRRTYVALRGSSP
jgi:hypothetical protein